MLTPSMKLVMTLSSLQSKIQKRIESQLSIHGISFTEFMVMYQLSIAPLNTMRRIELAESIGLSASGVTRLLAPMVKINLVQKEANPRDARYSLVKLSDAGEQLFNDALISFKQSSETLMIPIEGKQLAQLLNLAEKLL